MALEAYGDAEGRHHEAGYWSSDPVRTLLVELDHLDIERRLLESVGGLAREIEFSVLPKGRLLASVYALSAPAPSSTKEGVARSAEEVDDALAEDEFDQ